MRLLNLSALLTVVLCAACGGRVAGIDDLENGDDRSPAVEQTGNGNDRLTVLRARCAGPWNGPSSSDARSNAALAEGRWLRCPDAAGVSPIAFVGTFDALELTSDGTFFRLTVDRNGFERRTTELGDSGRWSVMKNGDLTFALP